jgi:hypothetical protein
MKNKHILLIAFGLFIIAAIIDIAKLTDSLDLTSIYFHLDSTFERLISLAPVVLFGIGILRLYPSVLIPSAVLIISQIIGFFTVQFGIITFTNLTGTLFSIILYYIPALFLFLSIIKLNKDNKINEKLSISIILLIIGFILRVIAGIILYKNPEILWSEIRWLFDLRQILYRVLMLIAVGAFIFKNQGILSSKEIIFNSFKLGLNNGLLILVTTILWVLTIWIPYVNVGTTIAMLGMITTIGKEEKFYPTEIFKEKYRKDMGEYFLLLFFMIVGSALGFAAGVIPGIVILIAWSQAIFLMIDKRFNPIKAIRNSNKITYGEKLTIFISYFCLTLILGIIIGIIMTIAYYTKEEFLVMLFGIIGYIFFMFVMIGFSAYLYGQLNKKLS